MIPNTAGRAGVQNRTEHKSCSDVRDYPGDIRFRCAAPFLVCRASSVCFMAARAMYVVRPEPCCTLRISYSFFADHAVEHPGGRFDFEGVHTAATVADFPHVVAITLVLVVECRHGDKDVDENLSVRVWSVDAGAREEYRVAPQRLAVRLCPRPEGGPASYHYLPVALEFMALREGVYHIELYRDGALWDTSVYRIALAR